MSLECPKKQNLFPDFSEDEFEPSHGEDFSPSTRAPINQEFQLPRDFWNVINSDPTLRDELNGMIEQRVREEIATQSEERYREYCEKAEEESRNRGYEDGFNKGVKAAEVEIEQARNTLTEAVNTLNEKYRDIISSHEELWSRTLVHLLKRFMVQQPNSIGMRIKEWLKDTIDASMLKTELKIRCSAEDYDVIKHAVRTEGGPWTFEKDTLLQPGVVACETNMGTIIFDPQKQLLELETMLDEYFGKQTC